MSDLIVLGISVFSLAVSIWTFVTSRRVLKYVRRNEK
jgi:hypothetical protein